MTDDNSNDCLISSRQMTELCAICLEELSGPVIQADCGHKFHTQCLLFWHQRKVNCPLCKRTHEKIYETKYTPFCIALTCCHVLCTFSCVFITIILLKGLRELNKFSIRVDQWVGEKIDPHIDEAYSWLCWKCGWICFGVIFSCCALCTTIGCCVPDSWKATEVKRLKRKFLRNENVNHI